jgi:hypothetical protein
LLASHAKKQARQACNEGDKTKQGIFRLRLNKKQKNKQGRHATKAIKQSKAYLGYA